MEVYNNCVSITHARKRRRKSIRRTRLGNRNVWARPIVLTRARSATAGESELCFHFSLHNSSFRFSVRRPAVGSSDWLDGCVPCNVRVALGAVHIKREQQAQRERKKRQQEGCNPQRDHANRSCPQ